MAVTTTNPTMSNTTTRHLYLPHREGT